MVNDMAKMNWNRTVHVTRGKSCSRARGIGSGHPNYGVPGYMKSKWEKDRVEKERYDDTLSGILKAIREEMT